MTIFTFDISSLRCVCGSATDVVCIEPGNDALVEFGIVLQRRVAARGWCAGCFTAFASLIPHEAQKKEKEVT